LTPEGDDSDIPELEEIAGETQKAGYRTEPDLFAFAEPEL
jgi:hypothetical protein